MILPPILSLALIEGKQCLRRKKCVLSFSSVRRLAQASVSRIKYYTGVISAVYGEYETKKFKMKVGFKLNLIGKL